MSKIRYIVVFVICVFASAILASATSTVVKETECTIQVMLAGEQVLYLEYGQPYQDSGATALVRENGIQTRQITADTDDRVDTERLGTYTIRYTAEYNGHRGTAYRRVHVVDTQPPQITLVSDPEKTYLPNESYVEEGFSATDGYDGDLTDRVRRREETGKIIYTVEDSSGNTASVTRTVHYNDPTPPALTLKGETQMIVSAQSGYREPGYAAVDNCDGDITAKVTVEGSVNVYKPGRYTLTYTAVDSFGNSACAIRSVFVKAPDATYVNDPTKTDKVIYLTFDDGPGPETPRLLDVLLRYNVQATFFVVNTDYISTVERAAAEGHTIAIHTATHKYKEIYASEEAFFEDLSQMQEVIRQYTGQTAMLMRFPGGSSNTISKFNRGIMTRLTKAVEEKGFTYFDWNVDSRDAGGAKTPDEVFNNVVRSVQNKDSSVVLMHDIKTYTVDAVETIILWGLENGYTFLPLTADSPECHHGISN